MPKNIDEKVLSCLVVNNADAFTDLASVVTWNNSAQLVTGGVYGNKCLYFDNSTTNTKSKNGADVFEFYETPDDPAMVEITSTQIIFKDFRNLTVTSGVTETIDPSKYKNVIEIDTTNATITAVPKDAIFITKEPIEFTSSNYFSGVNFTKSATSITTKFLLSVDNGNTWYTFKNSVWTACTVANIDADGIDDITAVAYSDISTFLSGKTEVMVLMKAGVECPDAGTYTVGNKTLSSISYAFGSGHTVDANSYTAFNVTNKLYSNPIAAANNFGAFVQSSAWTISFWFKFNYTQRTVYSSTDYTASATTSALTNYVLSLNNDLLRVNFSVNLTSGASTPISISNLKLFGKDLVESGTDTFSATSNISSLADVSNRWIHFALVKNSGTIHAYIDGKKALGYTVGGTPRIGCSYSNWVSSQSPSFSTVEANTLTVEKHDRGFDTEDIKYKTYFDEMVYTKEALWTDEFTVPVDYIYNILGNIGNITKEQYLAAMAKYLAKEHTFNDNKFVQKVTGKGLSTNDFSTAEQTKLSGIETGAQVNIIETVSVNSTALSPDSNGNINIDMSTYATSSDITSGLTYKGSVATYSALPSSNLAVGDVYNIETADTTNAIKAGDNLVWTGTTWDNLGGSIDLSGYVQAEAGKGLSHIDVTQTMKNTWDNIDANDDVLDSDFDSMFPSS